MLLQYGPHFFSTLSEKFGQLANFFGANGLPPPLAKIFPYAYALDEVQTNESVSHFITFEQCKLTVNKTLFQNNLSQKCQLLHSLDLFLACVASVSARVRR